MAEKSDRKFKRYAAKGRCRFCRAKITYVDWKDSQTLAKLTTGQGKMFSRKRSGNCARHQRMVKTAVKRARYLSLMPYVAS